MSHIEELERKRKEEKDKQSNTAIKSILENNLNEIKPKKKEETKSKKFPLSLKPSTFNNAKKKCNSLGISVNDCINQLLENWVKNS